MKSDTRTGYWIYALETSYLRTSPTDYGRDARVMCACVCQVRAYTWLVGWSPETGAAGIVVHTYVYSRDDQMYTESLQNSSLFII